MMMNLFKALPRSITRYLETDMLEIFNCKAFLLSVLLVFVPGDVFSGKTFLRTSSQQLTISEPNNFLLQKRMVVTHLTCAHWCLRTPLCLSFNLEKYSQLQHERQCELLSVDEKLRPDLVQKSNIFDHYSISDPCGFPCLNGGTCVTSKNTYECVCTDGYEGPHCEIISECVHYSNLSESSRNIRNGLTTRRCDSAAVINSGKWYRFTGSAGSRMLDTCPHSKCDTDFQGWLKEGQPNPGDVRVARTVCFQGNRNCCNWPLATKATHCGEFVVYQLKPLNCYMRYCGAD